MKRIIYFVLAIFMTISSQVESQIFNEDIKICVMSDVHMYDTTLGTSGLAFQMYLMQDRKLLVESESILKSAVEIIKEENPDFVLIAGDLTKDGERVCHEMVAKYLTELKEAGISSYVVPGNHDINNPHSVSFEDDATTPVPSVTPEEFMQIYNDYGYSDAIEKDDSSLSYIVEPIEGIQIFALDDCLYKENTDKPITGGRFSEATMEWIKDNLIKAKNENKIVLGMVHHGILEHYQGQSLFFPEYVIEGYDTVSAMFAQYGMKLVFTGHYHAQDITKKEFSAEEMPNGVAAELYDIETGSLVTSPNPVRVITISPNFSMNIESRYVTTIDFPTDTLSFQEYSKLFLYTGLNTLVPYLLTLPVEEGGYGFSEEEVASASPYLVEGFVAHYSGDESPTAETIEFINYLSSTGDPNMAFLASALGTLWTDLSPTDSSYFIENILTAIDEETASLPKTMHLYQNYPNPFNPTTNLKYEISKPGLVTLKIYDVIGREVATLINEEMTAGKHTIEFNAASLASGVYYYKLEHDKLVLAKSMILLK